MTDEKREIELLRRENRALEDDNFQKCEIIGIGIDSAIL